MYKDLDIKLKKVFPKKLERLTIIFCFILYLVLWFFKPQNWWGIVIWLLTPGIIGFIFIIIIYKNEKSDLEKAKIISVILNEHHIDSPKKLALLIESNRNRVQKTSLIQIASFLLSITAIFISIINDAEQYFNIIFILIIEILAISLVYSLYHDIFSNQGYVKELDKILNYLYINYEFYFNSKKNLIKRVISTLFNI